MPDDGTRQIIKVPFNGDTLLAVRDGTDTIVLIEEICDRLGVDWNGQRQRIKRNTKGRVGYYTRPFAELVG